MRMLLIIYANLWFPSIDEQTNRFKKLISAMNTNNCSFEV